MLQTVPTRTLIFFSCVTCSTCSCRMCKVLHFLVGPSIQNLQTCAEFQLLSQLWLLLHRLALLCVMICPDVPEVFKLTQWVCFHYARNHPGTFWQTYDPKSLAWFKICSSTLHWQTIQCPVKVLYFMFCVVVPKSSIYIKNALFLCSRASQTIGHDPICGREI